MLLNPLTEKFDFLDPISQKLMLKTVAFFEKNMVFESVARDIRALPKLEGIQVRAADLLQNEQQRAANGLLPEDDKKAIR